MNGWIIALIAVLVVFSPLFIASIPVMATAEFWNSIKGHVFLALVVLLTILIVSFLIRK